MISISTDLAIAQLAGPGTLPYLTGSTPTRMQVFTAPRPGHGGAGTTLLFEITLDETPGYMDDDTLVLVATEPSVVLSSGVPAWARFVTDTDSAAIDLDAGGPGSGKEAIVDTSPVVAGARVGLISCVLR